MSPESWGFWCFAQFPPSSAEGVVYYTFHSLTAVFIYEVILLLGAGAFVSR
ncbi:MAG: hypothetical protein MZV70_35425 [Desulfobacterales bacterium]|nr:hypothetical protein [Desulfobacterales bacterium]